MFWVKGDSVDHRTSGSSRDSPQIQLPVKQSDQSGKRSLPAMHTWQIPFFDPGFVARPPWCVLVRCPIFSTWANRLCWKALLGKQLHPSPDTVGKNHLRKLICIPKRTLPPDCQKLWAFCCTRRPCKQNIKSDWCNSHPDNWPPNHYAVLCSKLFLAQSRAAMQKREIGLSCATALHHNKQPLAHVLPLNCDGVKKLDDVGPPLDTFPKNWNMIQRGQGHL